MPKTSPAIDKKLKYINDLCVENNEQVLVQSLGTFLADKNNRVLAKAANLIEEKLLYALEPDLKQAYQRMLSNGLDANCIAKSALLRSLVALDCDDVDFYLAGLSYHQMEPSWGAPVDSAVDVRCSSAMGLVSTNYSRVMIELLPLLNDIEPNARVGAVRAIRYGRPYEAALVLRQKIMLGDTEPEIIGECFIALLQVEPRQSLPCVAAYLDKKDEELYEFAALALGLSRLDEALIMLKNAWEKTFSIHQTQRHRLVRAAVQHRSEAAFEWLLILLQTADENLGKCIIEQLSIYKGNVKLRSSIKDIVQMLGDENLHDLFEKYW